MGQCHHMCRGLTGDAEPHTTFKAKGGNTRRQMASERQIIKLSGLLAVNVI